MLLESKVLKNLMDSEVQKQNEGLSKELYATS